MSVNLSRKTKITSKGSLKGKTQPPSMCKVIIHNDDFTTQEFVVKILISLFGKDEPDAIRLMLDVHELGKGVAGVYVFDIAKTKAIQAENLAQAEGFPLRVTYEKE